MIVFYIFLVIMILILIFIFLKINQLKQGKTKVDQELQNLHYNKLISFGSVKNLSVLPLVDFHSDKEGLNTEAGVSYLIKADEMTILMDVGFNKNETHPSPLLQNMQLLGINPGQLDMIFISHVHSDHVGGMKVQKEKTFSISQGYVDIPQIPVYSPGELRPSKYNPKPSVEVVKEPRVLAKGIASIGVIPRFLFLMGYTAEQSLAINVEGKGIVLIIGCGHQTIEGILERARELFNEPIYGVIGGLHLPVNGGRIKMGPLNVQHIVGSDNPPWKGLSEDDVKKAIEVLRKTNPKIISLSPHDSSDWSIHQFQKAFQDEYVELKVGKEIII